MEGFLEEKKRFNGARVENLKILVNLVESIREIRDSGIWKWDIKS